MNKLKIAYTRTKFWFNLKAGGSLSHTLGVLKGFVNNNCEVKVISNERFTGIEDFNFEVIKPTIFQKRLSIIGEILYNFTSKRQFKKYILEFNPDYIYFRHSCRNFSIMQITKKLNIPVILEYNGKTKRIFLDKKKNIFKKLLNRVLFEPIYKIVDLYNFKNSRIIVVVSDYIKKDLIEVGINADKILVVPNGVDTKKFNHQTIIDNKKDRIKTIWGLEKFSHIVGFIGTFGEWHGIPQLVSAIKRTNLEYSHLNIVFLLVGSGVLKEYAEENLKSFRNVIFTGIIPYNEIEYYIDICDILVSPHCYPKDGGEFFGSPTKLFEYMAMGKGIVASNLGQIGEVLEHNKTAILVEPNNVENLVKGIIKLAKNRDLRNALGKEAKKVAYEKYTWDQNIKIIINILSKKG